MSFEIKRCPYCGRWCPPKLIIADKYNDGTSNVTTYEVVYPCICDKMIMYDLKPNCEIKTSGGV